ncbi:MULTISPECIES: hypothetical protein [Methylomonas]|uniref:Uncharacterized protein n=2 Tax=Methylomonas TaxID=416 RepID=A0A126T8C3_9GAMM|nr:MULTISPECIES: hypothetical protein [Methylomonas]AMK78326.1 hypothetical protein JT25_017840 [Methylomonas denitrificans]OAI04039.1 hypothetical protein A1342_05775 [Methylomonas methanica]TCV87643.1 hypothetical protein EDE11_102146 [Methylomonas methanica]
MNGLSTLAQAFAGAPSRIEGIDKLAGDLNRWYLRQPAERNFLHPCIIDGKPALVCQAGLRRDAEPAFAELAEIARRYGLYLKEDSRQRDDASILHNRRRNVGLVLSFCISMMASSRAVTADDLQPVNAVQTVTSQLAEPVNPMQAKLSVDKDGVSTIRLRQRKPPTAAEVMAAYSQKQATLSSDPLAKTEIFNFLSAIYQAESADPGNISADLAVMADYFSHYPQAVSLLNELRGQKLILKYKQNTWQTQAFGNQFGVDSVAIYFDTRLGAQLLNDPGCDATPACSISPADALLHELLHAKLMLLDSQHFIDGGGMAQTLYPFEHEREVINHENRLYQDMNQLDGRARPLRHRHSGELLQVSCPACNPIKQVASSDLSL